MIIENTILIRAHKPSADLDFMVSQLQSHTDFVLGIVADETSSAMSPLDGVVHISINGDSIKSLDLAYSNDVAWRCGDYGLYHALSKIPSNYYWIIEPDVFLNFTDLDKFFRTFDSIKADLIAPFFTKAGPHWKPWYDAISQFGFEQPYACLFPFVRVSGRAARFLLHWRAKISAQAISCELAIPNDESFVATVMASNPDFVSCDLNDFGTKFYIRNRTFNTLRPFSRNFLNSHAPDQMVYHPVRCGNEFRQKLDNAIANAGAIDWTREGATLLAHTEAELGIEERITYEAVVQSFTTGKNILVAGKTVEPISTGTVYISKYKRDLKFFVSNINDFIQRSHARGELYLEHELNALSRYFPEGGCLVDVGAHTGNQGLFMAVFGRASRVIAVEPNAEAWNTMEVNVLLNGAASVFDLSLKGYTFSNERAQKYICYTKDNWGAGFIANAPVRGLLSNATEVVKGDDVIDCEKIDLLSITQRLGALNTLFGLEKTIERACSRVFIALPQTELSAAQTYLSERNFRSALRFPNYGDGARMLFLRETA